MITIAQQFEQWPLVANQQDYLRIKTLDCHTGGEPLRIITSGFPPLVGDTLLAKRRFCQANFDHLRTALMFEPRGHADMYGAIVVEAERDNSHFGAIFIHNEGYSTMCGHAVIALAKFAVEAGVVPKTGAVTEVIIDVPCGQIIAQAYGENDGIDYVSFDGVPAYVLYENVTVQVPALGMIKVDIAFGGAYYAYVNASEVGLSCSKENYHQLISAGRQIKAAVSEQLAINHPFEAELSFLYGTIFIDDSPEAAVHSRNVCVFAEGEVDRSPTGSGVSGRIALHVSKNEVAVGQTITIESILGSRFTVQAIAQLSYGDYPAVRPRVTGTAFISGSNQWFIDRDDPLKNGFILR